MTLRVLENFAGVGTQRMALKKLGIEHEVVGITEIDKYAIKSYEAIHGEVNNLGDISKVNVEDVPDHDLFTYSFPCQDISVAGKQSGFEKGSGTRSGLLWECERVIKHVKPKYLLMENVKNLVGKKFKPGFDEWLSALEELGYTNYWQVLNAKDYGIPQNRERVFCVSILGEHEPYEFPEKLTLELKLDNILETNVDKRYTITQPSMLEKINTKGTMKLKPVKDYVWAITTKQLRCPNSGIVGIGNGQYRLLTERECWRLMGISDEDFDKAKEVNSNTQLYKQAGNAIVVDVLEAIFANMFK